MKNVNPMRSRFKWTSELILLKLVTIIKIRGGRKGKLPHFERRKTFANPVNLGVTGCKVK